MVLKLILIFGANRFAAGQGFGHIQNSLVAAATETKQNIPLFFFITAVYQQIALAEQRLDIRIRQGHQFFPCIAGIDHQVLAPLFQIYRQFVQALRLTKWFAAGESNAPDKGCFFDFR